MEASRINERRWLVLILLFYLFLAVGYSLLMPIWEAPDEPAHYHMAWFFARFGHFPPLQQNYEENQPKPYYYLASWVIRGLDKVDPRLSNYYIPFEYVYNIRVPVRRFDWNQGDYRFLLGVYTLRWINIIFGALALWLSWKAFQRIAPERPALRLAALALAALTPQYLHIMSSVSNDAPATLAGALLFYLAIRLTRTNSHWLALISIPVAIILPLATKLTALPVGAALLIAMGWEQISGTRPKRQVLFLGLAVLSVAILLYFFFPGLVQPALKDLGWRLSGLHQDSFAAYYLKFISAQIIWTYWGYVGWLAVGLHPGIIIFLTAFGVLGALMNAWVLIRTRSQYPQFNAWITTWLIALFTLGAVIRNGLTTDASQGRFLFPAIGALSFLMLSGWVDVLPQRIQRVLPLIVFIFMLICNLGLWGFGILPVYYQPFLG
jgi:hypothetical protein